MARHSPRTIIHASCLKHVYPDQTSVSLCGLEFVVKERERVAILGPSGCGKTTLLRHILGMLRPAEGKITVFDTDPVRHFDTLRTRIGFVMQDVDEQLTQSSVYDEIAFGPRNFGYPEKEVEAMVHAMMERMGIADLADRAPHYLSGGQKRKVALASVLVYKPSLLILDEPFQGLDPLTRSEYITLLGELTSTEHIATVMTLHEVELVPLVADSVYLLKKGGAISKKGKPAEVFQDYSSLDEYHLEPPTLYRVFAALQKKFPQLTIPLTIEEAEEEIHKLIRKGA